MQPPFPGIRLAKVGPVKVASLRPRHRCAVVVAAAVIAVACGARDSPATPSGTAGAAPVRIRVVSWNVQHGYSADKRHVNQEQLAFISSLRPDVVALQELAEWDNDMPAMYRQGIESMTGRSWNWRYEADLPHAPTSRRDGSALGTSLPVSAQQVLRLDDPSAPDDNNRNRSVIRFTVSTGGTVVDLATTHLDYLDAANRRSQVDRMQAWLAGGAAARIVAGDFNAEPGDATTWASWRGEYSDAWLSPGNPLAGAPGITMPLRSTTGLPGRIDYVWLHGVQVSSIQVIQTDLSDHYALVADLTISR
jgi:endonuclease/exonuclease/phosphatase family metal-dependent hydrolase